MIRTRDISQQHREKVIRKYRSVVGVDSAAARALVKKLKYKDDPYLLSCIALTYFDESRFKDDGSPRKTYDGRKMRLAERYIVKAYELKDDCIDVLWMMGKVRIGFLQWDLAAYCFERILELGRKRISDNDKCTDRSLVQVKVNDSRFALYDIYYVMGDIPKAKKYLAKFMAGLKRPGMWTLYTPLENFLHK